MKTRRVAVLILVLSAVSLTAEAVDDLKSYYEKKKGTLIWSFAAPELGSEVSITLTAGPTRSGVLMKLSEDSLTLLTDFGRATYPRFALKLETRMLFFAEDFAHVKALEQTGIYKDKLRMQNKAVEAAGRHDANLSVSAKTEKKADTTVETEDRENKLTGAKWTIRTKTRTATEVQHLEITVQNITTHPDTYLLEYFFFSKSISKGITKPRYGEVPVEDHGKIKLKNRNSKRITVPPQRRETVTISSNPFEVSKVAVSIHGTFGAPRQSGEEAAGYLVILKHGATVLDIKASAKSYLNKDWLSKFH